MSARILVVDDTPLNVKLLCAKLAKDYYVVSTAENGVEALEKVAKEKPDIILLDVMMPEMDGFETCRRLKSDHATAHIPVVMITALSDVSDRVRGLAAGADDFLGKPINDVALMARIRSLLRLKVIMDEWRLREATAMQLSPEPFEGNQTDPLNVRDSRVIIIDDDKEDANFIREALLPISAHVAQVGSLQEAENLLAEENYDLIYASLDMHEDDGLGLCARLRTNPATRHVPILLLANPDEIDRVAKGLDLGANDYLVRPFDTHELFARTRTQLRHKRNYDRLKDGLERNLMMALEDPLTGAFNRRYLNAHMPRFLKHAANANKALCVQMIDIDFFKKVNDEYGHNAGDTVLKEVAKRVLHNIRPSDLFVRMGGEEFAVVMPEIELNSAVKAAERLRHSIFSTPIPVEGNADGLKVSVSIGVAETRPASDAEPEKVFEKADTFLYKAKQTGRNRVCSELNSKNG